MKRYVYLVFVLLLLPIGVFCEDTAEDYDWRSDWEEYGYFDYCDVQGDNLIIKEGVTALGWAKTSYWDEDIEEDVEVEPKFEDGLCFDRSIEGGDFHRVMLPSTLRYLGMEAFCRYLFTEFTLPEQLEIIESDAFVYCTFDVLRIETVLPFDDILDSMYDSCVIAYEVPEGHPLYRAVDGVLFSADGKTLLAYPNGRKDTHYDVPAGVEHIGHGAFSNENLQTVSLPIGLRSVGDYGFSGCTRLQSVVLPLTVAEIGEDIFHMCVSLELVSLPEGLQASRNENSGWVQYYPDETVYRGDNGDTLGGERSNGSVCAPGRLYRHQDDTESSTYMSSRVGIYDSADAVSCRRYYRNGKIVYMGQYQNGRVSLYEPLGGNYATGNGYGDIIGWADIRDVQYLSEETLFVYASVEPYETMPVWWNHLPDYATWLPWVTRIPMEDRFYTYVLFGPFVRFADSVSHAVFACAVQNADMRREPDGTDNVYGIVYNTDFLNDIPLIAKPDGESIKVMTGGTQVRVLNETDSWYYLTDGRDTGWVGKEYVKLIPAKQEGEGK